MLDDKEQWNQLMHSPSLKQKFVSIHQKASVSTPAIHFFSPDILGFPLGFHSYL